MPSIEEPVAMSTQWMQLSDDKSIIPVGLRRSNIVFIAIEGLVIENDDEFEFPEEIEIEPLLNPAPERMDIDPLAPVL